MIEYQFYPPNYSETKDLYYIEYSRFKPESFSFGGTSASTPNLHKGWSWTLYKRHFFDNVPEDCTSSKEGHPYNLYKGIVEEDNIIALNTRKYLEFMVDAMNEKANGQPKTRPQ